MKKLVRVIIALVLAMPLYYVIDFGWLFISVMGLQFLAGLDIDFFD
ncbi:hypothetical protein [Gracilibacillus dipsosauri]|nr:hypothetical protein [Gracilibacillus dipsosauri]